MTTIVRPASPDLLLLDANVLIESNNLYYAIERVPEFWEWLLEMGRQERVKVPIDIYNEVVSGTDSLSGWLRSHERKEALILKEEVDPKKLNCVLTNGYGGNLREADVEKLKMDPYLIAYAVDNPRRSIVTGETRKPRREPRNRKVPDACDAVGVKCYDKFALVKLLDFKTQWRNQRST